MQICMHHSAKLWVALPSDDSNWGWGQCQPCMHAWMYLQHHNRTLEFCTAPRHVEITLVVTRTGICLKAPHGNAMFLLPHCDAKS